MTKQTAANKERVMSVAWVLVVIGSLNWLLVGVFNLNIVDAIFSNLIARVVYVIIGAAAVYILVNKYKAVETSMRGGKEMKKEEDK